MKSCQTKYSHSSFDFCVSVSFGWPRWTVSLIMTDYIENKPPSDDIHDIDSTAWNMFAEQG